MKQPIIPKIALQIYGINGVQSVNLKKKYVIGITNKYSVPLSKLIRLTLPVA
jgi:hypothetical protein